MMLRSSSTPVLGSLLSSSSYSSESPNHEINNKNNSELKKISFPNGGTNFNSFSCSISSPLSRYNSGFSDSPDGEVSSTNKGFRRAQSDGNLEGLSAAASCGGDFQEFNHFSSSPFKSAKRKSILQSIPSLSDFISKRGSEEDDYVEDEIENDGFLPRSVTIGENIMSIASGEFTYDEKMGFIEEREEDKFNEFQYLGQDNDMNPSLFLARGLGIDIYGGGGGGGGAGGGFNFAKFGEGGVENVEEIAQYYKKMVEENPSSALFLRHYAQFLYKSKGDLMGADEYYSRAILADPRDGEMLSQYARLVWELHHDHARACSYFERAVQAAHEDSHVHAAYASFLWEFGDSNEEEEEQSSISHNLVGIANFQGGEGGVVNEEEIGEYYQKMVGENPCNSLFLRNYAQFLYKSKGDLRQADEYYSRAILIDPRDGEILSQYARLVWELHHDYARACSYFERAVQAAPEDSHINAAYASFLWEAEDCEEENQQNSLSNNLVGMADFHGGVASATA